MKEDKIWGVWCPKLGHHTTDPSMKREENIIQKLNTWLSKSEGASRMELLGQEKLLIKEVLCPNSPQTQSEYHKWT